MNVSFFNVRKQEHNTSLSAESPGLGASNVVHMKKQRDARLLVSQGLYLTFAVLTYPAGCAVAALATKPRLRCVCGSGE